MSRIKNWKKVKENTINVTYKNIKTKKKISGVKDEFMSGTWWLPVHMSGKNTGHFIAGVDRSKTKEGIKQNLKEYMEKHPSGCMKIG